MPQLALAAASFTTAATAASISTVTTAAAATAAKATLMATLKSVAMNVLTNVAISAAMSVLQPQVGAAGRPFEFVIDPDGPIPFAAGRIGVAGSVIHRDTFGPDLMFYGIPAVLSGAGPITAIELVKADDYPMAFDANGGATTEPYRQELYFRSVLGEQPAPLALSTPAGLKNGAKLPGWGAAHKLSGKAAFLMVMAENSKGSAFPTGEVKPLVTLRGLKVYDPRQDSTYPGGVGPQRLSDPSTWTYSDNPALWAIKWSLGLWEGPVGKGAPQVDFQVGGLGLKPSGVDFERLVALANIADANGWTCSAYPNTDDDKAQVLDGFLQAAGAIYAQRAGKISCIQRAAPRVSVVTISAADTAGPLEIDTAASRIDRINTLRPRFWSEAHRWQMTALDGEITAQAYRDEDGAARTRGLDFPFVSNARQCGQLAALQIANTREGIAGVIPLKPHMQRIRPGDAFTITEPGFVLNGVKCLCLNTDYDPATGVVRVSFVSETDAKYPFAMGQNPTPPAPQVLTPVDPGFVSPPEAGDWTIIVRPPSPGGGQLPGFDLGGIVSNDTATAIIVEHGPSATGPWTQAYQGPPTVTKIPIDGLQPGATYYVAIQYQRNQNYSARQVYGPYTAPALVAEDTTNVGGRPVGQVVQSLDEVLLDVQALEIEAGEIQTSQTQLRAVMQGQGSLLKNPSFWGDWTGPFPQGWEPLASAPVKVGGQVSDKAVRYVTAADESAGMGTIAGATGWGEALSAGLSVIEMIVTLQEGSLSGLAAYLEAHRNGVGIVGSWQINPLVDPDVTGQVVGGGAPGRTYTFVKMIDVPAGTDFGRLFGLANWSVAVSRPARTVDLHHVSVRKATAAEVVAGRALGLNSTALSARNAAHDGALADVNGKLQAWSQKRLIAGSAQAFAQMMALDDNGEATSSVLFGAKEIGLLNQIGDADAWVLALSLINGNATFSGNVGVGGRLTLGNGTLWDIAVRSQSFLRGDGEVIDFGGAPIGIPTFRFRMDNLLPLNLAAGESYDLQLKNLTGARATVWAKISIPGAPSAQSLAGPGTAPGTGPTRQNVKTPKPDAVDGRYQILVDGEYRFTIPPRTDWGDFVGSVTVGIFARQGGVWTRVGGMTASWETQESNPGFTPIYGYAYWSASDVFQMGEGIEAFGASVESSTGPGAGKLVTLGGIGPINWNSAGTAAGIRSALAPGTKTTIDITPQG
ncbi:hypothetical protein [Brevundimonas bullata]|uniref:hypothetical protein n=1 Tax=Brevundimonas bullata TaxID=13160 RepID=UPI003D9A3870